ncbi:MAG: hypothetical protein LUD51_01360 [Clostridia bacterium]|nr:hypothetical protein [Clostridia bacterium]
MADYRREVSEEFMNLSETEKEAIWDFINRCEPYDKGWAVQLYNDCMRTEIAPFELLHCMKEEKLIDKGYIQSIIMYDGD